MAVIAPTSPRSGTFRDQEVSASAARGVGLDGRGEAGDKGVSRMRQRSPDLGSGRLWKIPSLGRSSLCSEPLCVSL